MPYRILRLHMFDPLPPKLPGLQVQLAAHRNGSPHCIHTRTSQLASDRHENSVACGTHLFRGYLGSRESLSVFGRWKVVVYRGLRTFLKELRVTALAAFCAFDLLSPVQCDTDPAYGNPRVVCAGKPPPANLLAGNEVE